MADVSHAPAPSSEVLDLRSIDVVDLDAPEVIDAGPRRRRSWRTWAVLGLVVALVAAVGTSVLLYRDSTAYASTPQWQAVHAYVDAVNANDLDKVRMATTNDVVWTGYNPSGGVEATYVGEDYMLFQEQFVPTMTMEIIGDPTVYGSDVAVPMHVQATLGVNYDVMCTFSTRAEGGVLRISAIMAIPVV